MTDDSKSLPRYFFPVSDPDKWPVTKDVMRQIESDILVVGTMKNRSFCLDWNSSLISDEYRCRVMQLVLDSKMEKQDKLVAADPDFLNKLTNFKSVRDNAWTEYWEKVASYEVKSGEYKDYPDTPLGVAALAEYFDRINKPDGFDDTPFRSWPIRSSNISTMWDIYKKRFYNICRIEIPIWEDIFSHKYEKYKQNK